MKSFDIRIISVNYSKEGDGVVVEIFGKTKEGTSIVARKPFRPYFYIIEPSDKVRKELAIEPEFVSIEDCALWYEGKDRPAVKITGKFPWKFGGRGKGKYRGKFESMGAKVVACDIPFHLRFIYDYDLSTCVRITGEFESEPKVRARYSTNIVLNAVSFQEVKPFNVPIKIFSYDIENSIKTGLIYCICCAVREGDGVIKFETLTGNEKDIIQGWIDVIKKHDPDVLVGYNSDIYDLPHIISRAEKLELAKITRDEESEDARPRIIKGLDIGRDGSAPSPHGADDWKLHGRIIADAWWSARRELKPKRETLNYVANLLFGESKEDVDSKKIDEEWAKDKEKVLSYCRKDAELALRILEHIRVVQKAADLAGVARLPLAEAYDASTSSLVDSFLIREADRRGIAVTHTRRHGDDEDEEKIEGGYVKLPTAGLYNNVFTIDVKSMYPSQIIKNNICFTTMDPNGTIISPHDPNVKYLSASEKEGVLPYLLAKWWKDRDEAKAKMKAAKSAGLKDEAKYYDGLQGAIKIMMNTMYGIFASNFYRFTNKDIGATITAFSREAIKGAAEKLEAEGVNVLYSDTDSLFILSKYDTLLETITMGLDISERYSEKQVSFEFEKILNPWFTHGAKKRYFGKVVWPPVNPIVVEEGDKILVWSSYKEKAVNEFKRLNGEWNPKALYWSFEKEARPEIEAILKTHYVEEDDMFIRGYETRRTDAFGLQSTALKTIFAKVLDRDLQGAIDYAIETVQSVKKSGKPVTTLFAEEDTKPKKYIPIDQLVISRTCQAEEVYDRPDSMVNVLVARKLVKMGADFTPGMRVSWIVTDGKAQPQKAEPYIDGRIFEAEPDYQYYAKRLASSLARVIESWGWDEKALYLNKKGQIKSTKEEKEQKQVTLF
jgi:DNA polymerase I